ncbi:odorant receptor 85b-like [Sitodiplosis mosellana]|uniref:odorant receptor 85b-like n=1 Tax=Sitodiplosis mosellana TaxID=263140 RepID=UPI002445114F|nr:odorant receptor 85b-like [Sitodiplosis mosellana]XP_055306185.1 odorant receptor 85b-like [Sitodiplosis mosellana]
MYYKYGMGGFLVIITVPSIASVLICWLLNGNFDLTLTFHPLKFLLPWDQTTLFGYFSEIIYNILISEAYMLYNGAVLIPFISICLHHWAFYKIFCHLLRYLDRHDENRNDKEFVCDIIDFHNSIKRWFSESAKLYGPHLMVQLICNMLMLVMPVFQLDQLILKQFDIKIFAFSLLCISTNLSNLFLCCYLGKLASESYRKMAYSLYECNWYEFPLDMQRYFILMIVNAQIPLHYHGYGLITLHLETFSNLMRTVFKCYMMFKTLTTN